MSDPHVRPMDRTSLLEDEEFVQIARDALDELPDEIEEKMGGVAVVIDSGSRNRNLMGVYDPRGGMKRIVLFKDTIERVGRNQEGVCREIRKTVLHEIGHHFGMSEKKLRDLGYG